MLRLHVVPALGYRPLQQLTSPLQLTTFLASIGKNRLRAAWHLAAMTGMRRGEVPSLRWADVDLVASRLAVRHTLVSVGYQIKDSTSETHQARTIDLDAGTITELVDHRNRQADERRAWGPGYVESDLVFRREDGSPVHPDLFSQAFEGEVRRSGLPRIRLHDLRHTHASIALRAGVPVKVISERLGHEDPAFTMKQYAHVIPGMQAEAARLVADLVAGSVRTADGNILDTNPARQGRGGSSRHARACCSAYGSRTSRPSALTRFARSVGLPGKGTVGGPREVPSSAECGTVRGRPRRCV